MKRQRHKKVSRRNRRNAPRRIGQGRLCDAPPTLDAGRRPPSPVPPIAPPAPTDERAPRLPSAPRRRWRRVLAGLAITSAAGLALLAYLAHRPPAWYQAPEVPESQRQAVRDDLERMADRFSMALLGERAFEICFSDSQLTRWLTARGSIWPAAQRAIPADWSQPMIRFEGDRVVVAARYTAIRPAPVVSLDLTIACDDDAAVVVRPHGLRVGTVRLPLTWMTYWTRELRIAERATEAGMALTGNVADGFRFSAKQRWWNGKRDFVVQSVRTSDGELCVEIQPLGGPRRGAPSRS